MGRTGDNDQTLKANDSIFQKKKNYLTGLADMHGPTKANFQFSVFFGAELYLYIYR